MQFSSIADLATLLRRIERDLRNGGTAALPERIRHAHESMRLHWTLLDVPQAADWLESMERSATWPGN
jgi:hypothetical protein